MVGRVLWIQLSRLVCVHDSPLFMRSDNGPEFDSDAKGVKTYSADTLYFTDPNKAGAMPITGAAALFGSV